MNPTLEYTKYLSPIAKTKSSDIEVFQDFVRMSVCALSCWQREEDYMAVAKRYNKNELLEFSKALGSLVDEMQHCYFEDLLGIHYQEIASKSTRDGRGEFYTPPCISEFMAQITIRAEEVIEKGVPFTVSEPTVWSGGMILKIAKQLAPKEKGAPSYVDLMRVTASDISPTAVDMSLLNFTLWGIPAEVYHQNSLSMETWGHWKNVHWHRVWEDQRRELQEQFGAIRRFFEEEPSSSESKEPLSEPRGGENKSSATSTADPVTDAKPAFDLEIPKREGNGGQFEMDF